MHTKNTNTTLLILILLLCFVVLGLGVYTYSFYNDVKENETKLIKEKELIKAELEGEIVRYNTFLDEKNTLISQLSAVKERLEAFQKQIDSNKITRSVVQQYLLELRHIRKEREMFFKQNDSLRQETNRLAKLQEHTQHSLDSLTKVKATIPEVKIVEKTPIKAPKITTSNLQAYGVIQRNSGKFVNTSRAARAQMVRVCYEVDGLDNIPASNLSFYVRMIDQNNKLIGIERKVTLDNGQSLSYNTQTSIDYQNQSYKICELLLPIHSFGKGAYTIEIYTVQGLVSTTKLILK